MARKARASSQPRSKVVTKQAARAARALQQIKHPGLNFTYKHQLFIAKAKRGEIWSLNHLSNLAKEAITPLLEMWPKTGKSLSTQATDLLTRVRAEWGTLPFFLDTRYIPGDNLPPSAPNAAQIFGIARSLNLNFVPVTSLTFSPLYQQEVRNAVMADGRGVLVRLFISDFINPSLLGNYLDGLLNVLNLTRERVDVLIDLEFRTEQIAVQQMGASAVSVLPHVNDWRNVILASGCFPDSISNRPYSIWSQVARVDWLGWLNVAQSRANAGTRIPSYGDYGVRCGGPPREIPKTPDPNIRYSDQQQVWVRREGKTNGRMKAICADLITMQEFSGANFSQGDAEIAATAARPGSPNNGVPEQWIQWCTNHHLELTALQIRNLP